MKTIFILECILFLALFGLVAAFLWRSLTGRRTASNAAPPNTEPQGRTSLLADEDGILAFRLVTKGTANDEAKICGAGDRPLGVSLDSAADGERVSVGLLGVVPESMRMVAAGNIEVGAEVYAAASGAVQALPAVAGTYWRVGTAGSGATAGADLIVRHHAAVRVVVIANAADLAAIKAAVTAPAEIMFLGA